METNTCFLCSKNAEFVCKCFKGPCYMCPLHVSDHLRLNSDHNVKQIGLGNGLFNPEIKLKLIRRIIEIKSKTKSNIDIALNYTTSIISKIMEKFSQFNKNMIGFIESCDEAIKYITNMSDEIAVKKYYIPLESFLMGQSPELINRISEPRINLIPFEENFIEYSASAFPMCLFEYCSNATALLSETKIIYNNGTYERKKKLNNNPDGRLLSVQENLVMYTGSCILSNNTFIIDLSSGIINKLPSLNKRRLKHAMTWIDGYPAVIGGKNNKDSIADVEVFKDNCWMNYPSLNIMRSNFSAASVFSKVFVFGGICLNNPLSNIEMFENRCWNVLPIELVSPLTSFGVVISGNKVLICGGVSIEGSEVDTCMAFDYKSMKITKINSILNKSMFFKDSKSLALNGEVYLYGFKGKSDEIEYNKLKYFY